MAQLLTLEFKVFLAKNFFKGEMITVLRLYQHPPDNR